MLSSLFVKELSAQEVKQHNAEIRSDAVLAESLQRVIEPLAAAHAGRVAVSVRVMDSDNQVICHWERSGQDVMPTASLIKLPVMIEAYRQAEQGELSLDELLELTEGDQVPGSGILTDHFSPGLKLSLRDAIRLMIRYSDNTATNLVADRIGLASTAQTMAKLGWPKTQLHSKVFRRDTSISPERSKKYGLGSTTADDMTELLVKLASGELVSAAACSEMLAHLRTCDDTAKLPRDLPAGYSIAHKTGSVNRSRTAAGIITGEDVNFAICVLTDQNEDVSWHDDNAAQVLIGAIARAVVDQIVLANADRAAELAAETESSDNLLAPTAVDVAQLQIPQLASGASGELVETLQRTLNARSSAGLGVDGDFGPATEAAVSDFQTQRELTVTGIVDAATWEALRPLVEQDDPVASPDEINGQQFTRTIALDPQAAPEVSATAWAVMDVASGEIVSGNLGLELLPNASTTKVMTALLVIELAAADPAVLEEVMTFTQRADETLGSTAAVRAGERVSVHELLYGLLLPSGNDAAVALAEHFGKRVAEAAGATTDGAALDGYDSFVAAMNLRALDLGMEHMHFSNPHGLPDAAHGCSAVDLARLARAAWQQPLLREIVNTRERGAGLQTPVGGTRNVRWVNTNRLLQQDGFQGMKTGTTQAAGACLMAVGQGPGVAAETIVVVLGCSSSDARYIDARNLFSWAWRRAQQPGGKD